MFGDAGNLTVVWFVLICWSKKKKIYTYNLSYSLFSEHCLNTVSEHYELCTPCSAVKFISYGLSSVSGDSMWGATVCGLHGVVAETRADKTVKKEVPKAAMPFWEWSLVPMPDFLCTQL